MIAAWIGPAIVAAVISALVTGMGWFVSERQAVRREAGRRRERVVDMQTALLAEIRASRHRLGDLGELSAKLNARMSQQPDYTPFITRPVVPFVLNAVAGDVHILPNTVIDPVVLYYRQISAIALLVDDLRTDRFDALDPGQKREIYHDYLDLLLYADVLAIQAMEAIRRSLNISDADLSGPLSGAATGAVSVRSASMRPQTPDMLGPSNDRGEPRA